MLYGWSPYTCIFGFVMCTMVCTRLDIAYIVSIVTCQILGKLIRKLLSGFFIT